MSKRRPRHTGYIFKRGSTYHVQWDHKGKRYTRSLRTNDKRDANKEAERILQPYRLKTEAESLAALAERLETTNDKAAMLANTVTIGQAWKVYLDTEKKRQPGAGTLADYEAMFRAFRKWLNDKHPDIKALRGVTTDHCRNFLLYLEKERELSGNRINKHRNFLRAMFRFLKNDAALKANPWDETLEREHKPAHRRAMTIEEMRLVIESATGELKTLFMLGTFTGLRLGDCATLKWGEIDVELGIIRRIPRKTARNREPVIVGTPLVLRQHLEGLGRLKGYVIPEIAALYLKRKEHLSRRIQAHLIDCGIDTAGEGSGKRASCAVGFHSLRHSYVTMQAAAGTPGAIVQKLVGHKNPAMTEHYTGIDAATARRTADALPSIVGEAIETREPLPAWAVKVVEKARSLKQLKTELLRGDR